MRLSLLRHPLGEGFDARSLFVKMHPEGDAFWLDSGQGGRAFLGTGMRVVPERGAALARVREELAALAADGPLDAPLGLVGWLGYELRGETTGAAVRAYGPHPDAAMLRVDRLICVEADGSAELLALGTAWEGELAAWRDATVARAAASRTRAEPVISIHRAARGTRSAEGAARPPRWLSRRAARPPRWRDSDARYLANIRACQAAIREGEAYQLCLTTEARVAGAFDPLAVFDVVRASSATHHGGIIRIGDVALVSASPERFLEVSAAGVVRTHPIKGTRPRHPDPIADVELRAELVASDKERAENLMIVDLMRNDLARVCELGSVTVTRLLEVESYPHVHQLVSTIEGRLRADAGAVDAVAACFPAGSMTGAPKLRAIEVLDALESRPRGLYAGAFGYLAADGAADLAMTIRTIVIDPDGASVSAGGGITALSHPDEELAEAHLKAAALLDALAR